MVEIDRRKAALIAELEISRGEIRRSIRACEENLDLVSVLRKNVRSNLKMWLPGAALGGWVASRLLSLQMGRPREVRAPSERGGAPTGRPRGWLVTMLKLGLDLARPALLSMATEWLSRRAAALAAAAEPGVPAAPGPRGGGGGGEGERHAHTRNGMF